MEKKKEFVPFLESNHLFMKADRFNYGHLTLIKREMLNSDAPLQSVKWEHVDGDAPKVEIIEENGHIKQIVFRCSCGRHAEVMLELEDSPETEG
ncbi:MAG: hypothetical protein Kow0037_18160 [Calditrichia bacterium]